MNITSQIRLALSAVSIMCLTSCADKYFEDQTLELYTRNFIKEFGLIDPQQDWNMAKNVKVSVNLGGLKPELVKVYTKTDDKYYLVARLKGVTGQLNVPVQVPDGTKEVMVDVDGNEFYGRLSHTIDCTGAPLSRNTFGGSETYSKNAGDYTVEVSYATTGNLYDQDRTADGLMKPIKGVTDLLQYGKDYTDSRYTITVDNQGITNFSNDNLELKSHPKSRYSYFNTQQILPIVMNGDGTETVSYYSLNERTEFTFQNQGILPEKGTKNQYRPDHIDKNGIQPDAVVKVGDRGKITVFPYYYNATYIHTFGIYLIENGKPVKDSGGNIIKYPVFNDKQPGDIQIAPKLVGIKRIACDVVDIDLGDNVNLYDYVTVYDKNDQPISGYPDNYSSKLGFHYYGPEFFTLDRDGNVRSLSAGSNFGKWDPKVEVAAENISSELRIRVKERFDYETADDGSVTLTFFYSTDQSLYSDWPSSLRWYLDNEGNYTFNTPSTEYSAFKDAFIGLYTKTDNKYEQLILSLGDWKGTDGKWAYVNSLPDPDDYTMSIENEDYNGNKGYLKLTVKFTPKASRHTNHKYSEDHAYDSSTESSSPITLSAWQNYFEEKEVTELETTLLASDLDLGSWSSITEVPYNWYDADKDDKLRFYYTNKDVSALVSDDRYHNISLRKNSSWGQFTTQLLIADNVDNPYDITITQEMLDELRAGGLYLCGHYVIVNRVSIVKPVAAGTIITDWKSDGKANAKATLEAYYANHNPGQKPCVLAECPFGNIDFTGVSPVVTISDDADVDHIKYTVSWTKYVAPTPAPKRNMAPKRNKTQKPGKAQKRQATKSAAVSRSNNPVMAVNTSKSKNTLVNTDWFGSRDGGTMPDVLKYPNTNGWRETNKIWDRTRPLEDEAASFITDDPVLARSRGYDIVIKDPTTNKPYTGYIGFYIDVYENPSADFRSNIQDGVEQGYEHWEIPWSDYNASQVVNDRISGLTYKYTLYSQRSQNPATYAGRNYEMSYAVAFPHPKSGRTFYSFEDWQITRPATGDKDVNGNELKNADYTASDNSSDRDYNDLIYLLQLYEGGETKSEDDLNKDTSEEGYTWIWALEDLGSTDDFDFNDVIIKINAITETTTYSKPGEGSGEGSGETATPDPEYVNRVTLTPLAAGGTLPIHINFRYGGEVYVLSPGEYDLTGSTDNPSKTATDANEYHRWFGINNSGRMINTGKTSATVGIRDAMKCVIKLPESFSLVNQTMDYNGSDNDKPYFFVTVEDGKREHADDAELINGSYTIPLPSEGKATQSFIIYCGQEDKDHTNSLSTNWAWPSERTPIIQAYPKFKDWVNKKAGNDDWMLHPSGNSGDIFHISY